MRRLHAFIWALGSLAAAGEMRPGVGAVPLQCAKIKSLHVADTTIATADTVAAGAFKLPRPEPYGPPADFTKLAAFCRVTGSIHPTSDSDIRFELWLPVQGWNGKFLQTGNGGAAGTIIYTSLFEPLSRGYAVANTDTGHQGTAGDFSWAIGHPDRVKDYAYRAVHELTVKGKEITAAVYGKAATKSYWYGCSTGGRQGLKEAQRYPEDYDAIVAGAPASNFEPLMALSILINQNIGGADGLGPDKLGLLHEAALAACDARDGVKDRVIGEPAKCAFDPAITQCKAGNAQQCLSASEVSAAQRIYHGVVTGKRVTLIPGTGPASELAWAAYTTPGFNIGTSYFRYVVGHDPNWDPATFNVDIDVARAEQAVGNDMAAMDPNLSKFLARGGKLITFHGATDGLIPYGNSVNYYNSLVAKLGADKVKDGVRFYLLPGVDHCAGGEGAFVIDWLSALEGWAEKGKAPGALNAAHPPFVMGPPGTPPSPSKPFTRPACVYPQVAKYKGSGDTADAVSFECGNP